MIHQIIFSIFCFQSPGILIFHICALNLGINIFCDNQRQIISKEIVFEEGFEFMAYLMPLILGITRFSDFQRSEEQFTVMLLIFKSHIINQ